jgi:hypothetical protein
MNSITETKIIIARNLIIIVKKRKEEKNIREKKRSSLIKRYREILSNFLSMLHRTDNIHHKARRTARYRARQKALLMLTSILFNAIT